MLFFCVKLFLPKMIARVDRVSVFNLSTALSLSSASVYCNVIFGQGQMYFRFHLVHLYVYPTSVPKNSLINIWHNVKATYANINAFEVQTKTFHLFYYQKHVSEHFYYSIFLVTKLSTDMNWQETVWDSTAISWITF